MTPAELLAWAAQQEETAEIRVEATGDEECWNHTALRFWKREIADLRLAARLARFAAELGGLPEEETDGKA